MARDFVVTGECLVKVKGAAGSLIGSLSELGLSDGPINVQVVPKFNRLKVNAWGDVPPEIQSMLAECMVTMTLIHFDPVILDACVALSQGGASAAGTLARAGARLGNNSPRLSATNFFIGLNLTSPVEGKPYRFLTSYIDGPVLYPFGVEAQIAQVHWSVIPYTMDPYGGGLGAQGSILYDNNPDN